MTTDAPPTVNYYEDQSWQDSERRRIKRTRRILVGVLAVLIVLLLIAFIALIAIFQPVGKAASGAQAGGVTWIRSIYGWGKGTDQQLVAPQGTAFGPDGDVWATTQGLGRVVGFRADGTPVSMLFHGTVRDAKPSADAFAFPVAVAVGPDGRVYVADQQKSTVWVMDRNNTVLNKIFVPTPASVAVSNDRLVVGSASGFVIMTPSGQVVKVLGTQGKGINQFNGVHGAAIGKDGTIYVTDQYNNRVSAYDRNGNRKWIVQTGNPGNDKPVRESIVPTVAIGTANMQIPAGITVDGANRLVIADPFGFDLTVLASKDGKLIAKYGQPGTIDGQFVYPSSIAYDSFRDYFAVADTGNGRVQIIRLPGSGGSLVTAFNQTLAGPLGACLFPLLLLLLIIFAIIVYRVFTRRRRKREAEEAAAAQAAAFEAARAGSYEQ